MFRCTHKKHTDEEDIERQDMYWLIIVGDEGEWKDNGYNISKEVLHRRRIETRKGNRRGEAVMELVIASIEPGMVEQAVNIVCQGFAC